jgi:hypothetical protein
VGLRPTTAAVSRGLVLASLRATRVGALEFGKVKIEASAADRDDLEQLLTAIGQALLAESSDRQQKRFELMSAAKRDFDREAIDYFGFDGPEKSAEVTGANMIALSTAELTGVRQRIDMMQKFSDESRILAVNVQEPKSVANTAASLAAGLLALLLLAFVPLAGIGFSSQIASRNGNRAPA